MFLQLPKWMVKELIKDTDLSVQLLIKDILKEYLNSEEGMVIKERIERRREGY